MLALSSSNFEGFYQLSSIYIYLFLFCLNKTGSYLFNYGSEVTKLSSLTGPSDTRYIPMQHLLKERAANPMFCKLIFN